MRWLVVFSFVVVGCVQPGLPRPRPVTTLEVESLLAVPVGIYIDGARIGTADPMRTTCLWIRTRYSGAVRVVVRPLAERGWTVPYAVLLDSQPGWRLDLSQNQINSSISLRPGATCERRE